MCGIAGFVAVRAEGADGIARAMATKLAHRGPDDSGIWVDPTVCIALAHRRLSIIDLSSAGHQPMVSASGRFVIALNGEIYNHQAIRRALESEAGVRGPWRGHSDTETLLAAIEAWGLDSALAKAVGMFAIALWDRESQSLFLVRDRLGEKPLYYGWQGSDFLFASELKAFKAHPAFRAQLDRHGIALFLERGYVPAPASIYEGVHKLAPGAILQLRFRAGESKPKEEVRHYWSLNSAAVAGQRVTFEGSRADAVVELERKLVEAVRLQMIADVPLGAFLSGGVDSSTIVALMQASATNPVKTFTIGFKEEQYDESNHARRIADFLGTDHTEAILSHQEALACIPQLPSLYDEPFADASQIPTFLVSQLARKHVTVSLSGDAGDELFGGYNHYSLAPNIWSKVKWLPVSAREVIADGMGVISDKAWRDVQALLSRLLSFDREYNLGDKVKKFAQVFDKKDAASFYQALSTHWSNPDRLLLAEGHSVEVAAMQAPQALREFEHQMMFIDAAIYLPDDILVKVDRAAMSVGLETRIPLLDHRVVEFAWRLPLSMKISKGRRKWVLRELLFKHIPRELIERPKKGFSVPIGQWLRGPLRTWAESLLQENRIRAQGILDPIPIRTAWHEHLSGARNWDRKLWTVLMLQTWLEEQGARLSSAEVL